MYFCDRAQSFSGSALKIEHPRAEKVAGSRARFGVDGLAGGRRGKESREEVREVGGEDGLHCACEFYTHALRCPTRQPCWTSVPRAGISAAGPAPKRLVRKERKREGEASLRLCGSGSPCQEVFRAGLSI